MRRFIPTRCRPKRCAALVPWMAGKHLPVAFLERGFTYANCAEATGNGIVEPDVPVLDPVRALTRTTYQLSAFISPEWESEFLRHCPGCVAVRWNDQFADILPAGGGKDAGAARDAGPQGPGPGAGESRLAMRATTSRCCAPRVSASRWATPTTP